MMEPRLRQQLGRLESALRRARLWRRLAWCWLAATALCIGLVNVVTDSLDEGVETVSSTILKNSPTAIRRGLYALKRMEAMSFEEAAAFTEGQIGLLALTEDAREGMKAFAEKRAPVWKGQ